jgi:GT2 family glycosyltransferase
MRATIDDQRLRSRPFVHDLAVIITSLNESDWLRRCLPTLFERAEGVDLDVVVVDIESSDDTQRLLREEYPQVRLAECTNRGFSHANNRGVLGTDARYVLFLNPDTEWVEGSLRDAVDLMDARPTVGLAGCRQLTGAGDVYPTMRRFMTPARALAEAVGSERFAPSAGQRILDLSLYERETSCDWVIGSFMLTRREALLAGGLLDERFFLYSEEEDFCRRIRDAGWDIRHLPSITIVHHVGKAGLVPRFEAQRSFARLQYGRKHFGAANRAALRSALVAGYAARMLRALVSRDANGLTAAKRGMQIATGRAGAPFIEPPPVALPPLGPRAPIAGDPSLTDADAAG